MPIVRFNALKGTWEFQRDQTWEFTPISYAAALWALAEGIRQAPMWTGPKLAQTTG